MTVLTAKTVQCILPVSIQAPVEKVFPLVSPVEEYRWIPGWKCNLVHCPNDRVELGTVFSEISSAPFLIGSFRGKTIWTVVSYEPENYRIHFRLDNKNSSSLYKIELEDDGNGGTGGKLDLTYHAMNAKGNRLADNGLEGKIKIMLSALNAMLTYYRVQGTFLPLEKLRGLISPGLPFSFKDKILLVFNRLARRYMIDKDRGRFMKKFFRKGG